MMPLSIEKEKKQQQWQKEEGLGVLSLPASPDEKVIDDTLEQALPSVESSTFLSGKDIFFIGTCIAVIVVMVIGVIFMRSSSLGESHQLQTINQKIQVLTHQETTLKQEVETMSNYDRVVKAAEEQGLSRYDENIRNIQP